MKAEVDKIDIIKLVNVLISLNKLETKVDILDVAKYSSRLEKKSSVIDNEVAKNAK